MILYKIVSPYSSLFHVKRTKSINNIQAMNGEFLQLLAYQS